MLKIIQLWFFSLAVLTSCAVTQQPYYMNEIVVRNSANSMLVDVKVQSEVTGRMFRCGNVAPGAQCSDSFSATKYEQNKIRIEWIQNNRYKKKTHFQPEVPSHMSKAIPLRGVLEIRSDGSFLVFFEQDVIH